MSAASDHVRILLTIDSVGLQRAGFGIMGILSHTATFPERVRYYSSIAAVGVDFATDSAEYRAANAAFAQSPKPKLVAVLRATGTVTQRYDIGVVAAAVGQTYTLNVKGKGVTDTTVSYKALANLTFVDGDVTVGSDLIAETAHGMATGAGPFRLSNSGGALPAGLAVDTNYWIIATTADTYKLANSKANALANTPVDITAAAGGGTHTLLRAANDVIIAQLLQGLNAVVGANYTATQTAGAGDTDTLRVTGNATGNWFSLEVTNLAALSSVQSHAAPSDVTLATDLAAILVEDSGWYCLITLYNSSAYILAAAAWVESNGRIYVADSSDSEIATVANGSATHVFKSLQTLGYARTMGDYYLSAAAMLETGIMGRWLPTLPGKATAKFKTLAGIAGLTLTDTQKVNIRACRANSYEQVLPDRAFFWEGTVFSTTYRFIDITRNADWLQDEAQKAILGVFVGNDIVPFSPDGITMLEGSLRGVGALAERQGVLLPGWEVTAPDFADVPTNDIEQRTLDGLKLEGRLRNPIHKADPVDVVLTF